MVSRRTLAALAIVGLVALAGCGASTGGGSDGGAGGGVEQATEIAADSGARATGTPAATQAPEEAGSGASGDVAMPTDRAIIRTGTVAVEVDDFGAAQSNLTTTVEGYGGYVSDTRQDRRQIGNETWIRGEMVLRVPSEEFDALVADAQGLGEVQSVEVNSRDVTDQLVDIEARLENLRAERDRLRELYQQANDTEDVLAVQRELSDVQGEIERLEARQQNLQRQVAYSTLTVRLEEPRPTPNRVAPDRWYDTPVLSAFMQSVDGVVVVARAVVVGFAFALPYLIAFALPVLVVAGLLWRVGRRYLATG
ncbi:DUF4349 domain-containing protein [Halobellus sp. H-GB7]|uniref:DUF4349 domain-containing protein n=1 Tax=Halobellus sp. H-GB7 TaxID=3069756 RepID=UPI0027B5EC90|nr:DUF4349 domain-containing protein [Halobellus sp. H-GB7]MDQ2054081.1 DUF4349 domain-containing protein [Halobellus sp. H-GB7]